MDIQRIVGGLIVAAFAFGISYKCTGKDGDKLKAYITCVCVTYAVSVGLAELFGAPIKAGEIIEATRQTVPRDVPGWSWKEKVEFSRFIFWVSLLPAMVGVYCARRWPDDD